MRKLGCQTIRDRISGPVYATLEEALGPFIFCILKSSLEADPGQIVLHDGPVRLGVADIESEPLSHNFVSHDSTDLI
jgi:hypothetical protein